MIQVEEVTMRYLELLHFEVVGYQNILKRFVVKPNDLEDYHIDEETKNYYLEKYQETFKEYELIKKEIIDAYVPKDKKDMVVTFNFNELCIELSERGACKC